MSDASPTKPVSKSVIVIGYIMTFVPAALLLMGAVMDLARTATATKGAAELGYAPSSLPGIGIALLVSIILYLCPRTCVLGAVLLTGYLGGAVATHVRVSAPIGMMLTPVIVAVVLWGGLFLRMPRLRALFPVSR